MSSDFIDQVLSITSGSYLDQLRRHREVARDNIQKAYEALFSPRDAGAVSLQERWAIASFVAGLHGQLVLADHYAHHLSTSEGGASLGGIINSEIERGTTEGPYGHYPEGPLTAENKHGLIYNVSPEHRDALGEKLTAALEHAHLLIFRPRGASKSAINRLVAAGWSTAGVVTISQLVSYLAFQSRIVEGLSALAAAQVTTPRLPNVVPASAIV
jgi:CMD domain protein